MANRITGLYSGLDTESLVKSMTSKYQTKIDNLKRNKESNELKTTAWNALNSKLYSFYTGAASSMKLESSYTKTTSKSSSDALTVSGGKDSGTQSVKIIDTAKTAQLTSAKLDESVKKDTKLSELGLNAGTYKFNNKNIVIAENDTMDTLMNKIKSTGLNANFDEEQNRIFISAKEAGADSNFDLTDAGTDTSLIGVLGIPSQAYLKDGKYYSDASYTKMITDQSIITEIKNGKAAIMTQGSDAMLEVNGALYKSKDNTFKINDATYTINKYTDEEITVSTTKDTSAVYNNVKSFINSYNDIINEMTKSYNTSNQGYKPLTDDEEDAMSEKEVEKWNSILEASSLYKDDTLGDVINNLKSVMNKGIQMSDGTTMYLSDFGIGTGNYFNTDKNQRNAYNIDGDKDYASVSTKTNKLQQMIEEDPEKVEEFFNKLSKSMYDTITSDMKSTEYNSMYKVYNDKQLATVNKRYEEQIEKWEKKMHEVEEKYYKQFTSMEKMLAEIQSQSNYLNNLFMF